MKREKESQDGRLGERKEAFYKHTKSGSKYRSNVIHVSLVDRVNIYDCLSYGKKRE